MKVEIKSGTLLRQLTDQNDTLGFISYRLMIWVTAFVWMSSIRCSGQTMPTAPYLDNDFLKTALAKYPFIKDEQSYIHNASALDSFFIKLNRLQFNAAGASFDKNSAIRRQVTVAHIGDSHIQAGYFTAPARTAMAYRFGNAGRGMVFPYRLAKSNGPSDYASSSNVQWNYQRSSYLTNDLPVGIAGFTISSNRENASLTIRLIYDSVVSYNNNYLLVFHRLMPDCFGSFVITDSTGEVIAQLTDTMRLQNSAVSKFRFNQPPGSFTISKTTESCEAEYYGFALTSDSSGVVYHTIGVNGAKYDSYLHASFFNEQLTALNPDLIILSLGTNEGFDNNISPDTFIATVDSLVQNIRKENPGASIMMTLPGESFIAKKVYSKRKKYVTYVHNPALEEIHSALKYYCQKNHIAYWDLYEVMGGKNSMAKWFKYKMADKRRVHFSKEGYFITGELFYTALNKAYDNYQKKFSHLNESSE